VRFRKGCFAVEGSRVRLAVARGAPELWVRLARELPYPSESIRSLTLVAEAGRLYDVTAEVAVEVHDLDPARFAGVDLGIIHPYAVMAGDEALLVSGRAIRSEERLHLEDTKRRSRNAAGKAPSKGERGSRRWRRHRAFRRRTEARHRRRVRQGQHEAAKGVFRGWWSTTSAPSSLAIPRASPPGTADGARTCGFATGGAPTSWRAFPTRPSWRGSRWCW
jgi:transposase